MKHLKKIHIYIFVFSSYFLSASCVEKGRMDTTDAWIEVYVAIHEKAKECGNHPQYILPVFEDPKEYGVRLCSLSILRQDCPFNDYPLFCLEMLEVDLPYIGP
ncbi:MAG: hypothetical protein OEZ34_05255 [Spirochaetia bacterium]|nr:hypothetical protein [Spirochaetia bacterium]